MADLLALSGDREVPKVTAWRWRKRRSSIRMPWDSSQPWRAGGSDLGCRLGRTQNLLCPKRPPVLNTWNSNSSRVRCGGSLATAGTVCLELDSRSYRHESFQLGKTSEGQEDRDVLACWRFANALSVGEGEKRGKQDGRSEQFLFSCHRLKQRGDRASSREQPRHDEDGDWAAANRMRRGPTISCRRPADWTPNGHTHGAGGG